MGGRMVSSAELQLINDNSQPENDKEASGGDSPKVRIPSPLQTSALVQHLITYFTFLRHTSDYVTHSLLPC